MCSRMVSQITKLSELLCFIWVCHFLCVYEVLVAGLDLAMTKKLCATLSIAKHKILSKSGEDTKTIEDETLPADFSANTFK